MASPIPWTKIKALSFDIYGTLIDWESSIVSTARATAIGPYLPADRTELLANMEKYERAVQQESPNMLQREIIAEGLRRYAQELKVVEHGKLSEQEVEQAAQEYGSGIGSYAAFSDTVAVIQSLGRRYQLVPLSNVDHASFAQTLAGPLKGCHFDAVYTAEDIGSYKPSLRNFHYLLDHVHSDLGVEKAGLCHVAQSLYHDHLPAKEMGIRSVWVDRKGVMGQSGGDSNAGKFGYRLRVESLGELAGIVEEAFREES